MGGEYLLVLGSNHNRARMLRFAQQRLREHYQLLACTGVARTRSADGSRYLNAAVRIAGEQGMTADALKRQLRAIEDEAGRARGGDVCVLDIDLLAACSGTKITTLYKPADLDRDYVRALLGILKIEIDPDIPGHPFR